MSSDDCFILNRWRNKRTNFLKGKKKKQTGIQLKVDIKIGNRYVYG